MLMEYFGANLTNVANQLLCQFDIDKDPTKLKDAAELYKTSLRYTPDFPSSYVGLANVYLREYAIRTHKSGIDKLVGKVENRFIKTKGVKAATKAVELGPDMPHAHLALGRWHDYSGKLEDALYEMETAISLDPNFATAHHDIGVIYIKKGDTDKARLHLQKAVDLGSPYLPEDAKIGVLRVDR